MSNKISLVTEPGGLQSVGLKELDMTECICTHTHIHTHTQPELKS